MIKPGVDRKMWIDIAKGISILLVLFAHIANGYKIFVNDTSLLTMIIDSSYVVSLHTFFFLSGLFAVKLDDRNFIDVFKSKFHLIFIPYIIWAVIMGFFKMVSLNHIIDPIIWSDFLFIPIKPIGITWFLYVLFWSYIIYKLLSIKFNIYVILPISVVLLFIRPFVDTFVVHRFLDYFAFFILGVAMSKIILNDNCRNYFKLWIALPVLLILHWGAYYEYRNILIALNGIYLIIAASIAIEKYGMFRIISYIGSLSLVIYLIHMIPMTAIRVVLINCFHITNIYLYISIQFILTITICLFINKILEKFKVRRYLFGR